MTEQKYDLVIAYRIYPKVSKVPPVYPDDKYKLADFCLRSFKEGLGNLKVKIYALVDACPPEYQDLFKKYFSPDELELVIYDERQGNYGTFKEQIRILLEQTDSEYIYFAEDDYFYLKDQFKDMLDFIKQEKDADFISPYDHLDYYLNDFHKYKSEIKITSQRHWRSGASTCLTFLTTKEKLRQAKEVFLSYSIKSLDVNIWAALTKYKVFKLPFLSFLQKQKRWLWGVWWRTWFFGWKNILFGKKFKVWAPIPSIANHMENNFPAPTINWDETFKLAQKRYGTDR